jgi:hypothetical protein
MRLAAIALVGTAAACATVPFERYVSQQRWTDAAAAFDADTTLLDNERALFDAAMLFSSPARGAYNPEKARVLLRRFLARFPESKHQLEASDRLALMDSALTERNSASMRAREVEARIAALIADTLRLRAQRDSAGAGRATSERNAARLEADLRDRDEQLRQLRLELARLKEIDLKPRRPR